jgi:hypothetical protein
MIGGLTFSLYFIGLSSLLDLFSPPLGPQSFATVKMAVSLATSLCLAGGPLGLLALAATGSKVEKVIGVVGAALTFLSLNAV